MAVDTNLPYKRYVGNGATSFPFKSKVNQSTELRVAYIEIATGLKVDWTIGTEYNATGFGGSSPYQIDVVPVIVLPSTHSILIYTSLSFFQENDYVDLDQFPADRVEDDLDQAVLERQELKRLSDQSLKIPIEDLGSSPTELPSMVGNENTALTIDGNGALKWESTGGVDPVNLDDLRVSDFTSARAIEGSSLTNGDVVYINGHTTQLDGGQGPWQWDATSTATDNNGTILKLTDTTLGRLIRDDIEVSINHFGASPSGSSSVNSTAIQAAFSLPEPINIPNGTYDFDSQLIRSNGQRIYGEGTLNFTGASEDAIVIGVAGANTFYTTTEFSSIRLTRDSMDWTDQYSGISVLNMVELRLDLYVRSFYAGISLGSDGATAYNQFRIQRIDGCRHHVQLIPSGSSGYCNENNFWGGRFSSPSSVSESGNQHFIYIKNESSGTDGVNAARFYGCSFESSSTIAGYKSILHGDSSFTGSTRNARQCIISDCRFEFDGYAISGAAVSECDISLIDGVTPANPQQSLINADTNDDFLTLAGNTIRTPWLDVLGTNDPCVISEINRPDLVELLSGNVAASGNSLFWSGASSIFTQRTSADLESDRVVISSSSIAIGVLLKINNSNIQDYHQRVSVIINTVAAGGRACAVPFNSSFTALTGTDDCSFSFNETLNGYRIGTDLTLDRNEFNIAFGADVSYLFVGISGGSSSAQFSSLKVLGFPGVELVLDSELLEDLGTGSIVPPMTSERIPYADSIPAASTVSNIIPNGQFVRNFDSEELGSVSSKYVITGWQYSDNDGSWLECRCLTGN